MLDKSNNLNKIQQEYGLTNLQGKAMTGLESDKKFVHIQRGISSRVDRLLALKFNLATNAIMTKGLFKWKIETRDSEH